MDPLEIFRMAIDTIKAHKLRSVLTTLGVLIGVGAVLANIAMVNGFDIYFQEEVMALGANFVQLTAGDPFQSQVPGGEEKNFEEHIYDTMKRLPNLDGATAYRESVGTMKYRGEEKDVLVRGVEPGYFKATETPIINGITLGKQDKYTSIINTDLKKYTFKRPMAVGTTFELTLSSDLTQNTQEFRVKGIYEQEQSMMMQSGGGIMKIIYIPVSTMNDMLNKEGYTTIGLYAESSELVDEVERDASNTLNRLLRLEPLRTSAQEKPKEETEGGGIIGGEQQSQQLKEMGGEREEYSIISSQEILDFAREISSTIELLFIGVASISLVVGGIGISNIMLVTVSERTREIGVMKAVGARNLDVLMIFLLEAGLIGLIGGIIGLSLSFVLSLTVIPMIIGFSGIIPLPWIGIALGLSFGIGVISGLYPAWRAAQMDPVEALSYE